MHRGGGRGQGAVWIWNHEHKVWVPERAQRANDDEELIEDMERNYGRACRKLRGMEKQREYLFGVIKDLRGDVRKWQESTWFWKARFEQTERERVEQTDKFETPAAEVFETPMALMVAPVSPPPPPPPVPRLARPTSRSTSTDAITYERAEVDTRWN